MGYIALSLPPHRLTTDIITLREPADVLFFSKMIGQKTINSFFSPVSKKRISKELNEEEEAAKDPVSGCSHKLPTESAIISVKTIIDHTILMFE